MCGLLCVNVQWCMEAYDDVDIHNNIVDEHGYSYEFNTCWSGWTGSGWFCVPCETDLVDAVALLTKSEEKVLERHHPKSLEVCRKLTPTTSTKSIKNSGKKGYQYGSASCVPLSNHKAEDEAASKVRFVNLFQNSFFFFSFRASLFSSTNKGVYSLRH